MVLWEIQIRCHLISSVWGCYIYFSGSHVKVPVFCLKSLVKGECFFSLVWSENTVLRRSVHLSGRVLGRDHLRSLPLLFIVQCLGGVKFSDWRRSEQWGNCLDRWCASQIFYRVTVTLKGREKNREGCAEPFLWKTPQPYVIVSTVYFQEIQALSHCHF